MFWRIKFSTIREYNIQIPIVVPRKSEEGNGGTFHRYHRVQDSFN